MNNVEPNVGGLDRSLRIAFGLASVVAMMRILATETGMGVTAQFFLASGLLLLSALLFGTVGAETCPINHLLGRNTKR